MGTRKAKKINISPEGRKIRSEHGHQNLVKWKQENPGQCHTTHGATNKTIRKRYTDLRTTEGKNLQAIIDGFTQDCGGPDALDTRQQVLLGGVRTKLITILIISDYIDKQITEDKLIVNGDLIPILAGPKKGLLEYTESLKKDLEALYQGNRAITPSRVPSIQEIIQGSKTDGD
jgi:hypothetical protein